ncbi:MAG: FAD-binding oxidoreductase [Arachnia sp.]
MSILHEDLDAPTSHRATRLRNFGGSSTSLSRLEQPCDDQTWERLFSEAGPGGVTVRGSGTSYSDAALNQGGTVALTTGQPRILDWDRDTGVLYVDAGVTLEAVLSFCVPRGWSLPVMPGTAHATVGGALAADVHGRNHRVAGSFSSCVEEIALITPARGALTVGPGRQPEFFWATVGGLGLTGVIARLRLQLAPISTSWLVTSETPCADLDHLMTIMLEREEQYEHVVGWVDGHAPDGQRGRGVVSAADRMGLDDLPASLRRDPLVYCPAPWHLRIPKTGNLVRPAVMRVANAHRLARARRHPGGGISDYSEAFHPLDALTNWPALYGHRGLVQYQFAVPPGQEGVLHTVLRELTATHHRPTLVTLKHLGESSPGHMSFAAPGWTMVLDFPADVAADASALLHRLDLVVCATGGRIYLMKNNSTHPDLLPQMYPRLGQWRVLRDRLDPRGVLTSDLDRHLNLTGHNERVQS